ncbi:MAG: cadherin domain-containing protein [Sphingorhabdus sp.]
MVAYSRLGLESVVNTQTTGDQFTPSVAGFAAGGFVVVWQTTDTTQDGSGRAIRMQRYDASGAKIGTEVLVNTLATGDQSFPSVTALVGGGFIVTWQTSDALQDGSGTAIKAQLFDASDMPIGSEFRINSQVANDQTRPAITALESGGFVATWQTADTTQDGLGSAIKGQIYNASGVTVGAEFLVNQANFGHEAIPSITGLSGGGFVSTWTVGSGANSDVYGQLFNAAGVKVGAQFIVSTVSALGQFESSVTQISDGRFVVTWTSAGSLTTNDVQIKAQMFSNAGVRIGGEFLVNTTSLDPNINSPVGSSSPQVEELPDGGFIITWTHSGLTNNIRGQRYDTNGQAVGGEITINTVSDRNESTNDLAVDGNGNIFSVWSSATSSATNYDIRGQFFSVNAGPVISSNGGGESAAIAILENTTAVTTIAASNPNGASSLTYSIIGGLDATRFTINASTGVLSFVSARNFEVRQDFGANNVYDVVVAVSDGTYSDVQTIAVTIQNVNEGQTFNATSSPFNFSSGSGGDNFLLIENVTGTIATFSATDADGTPVVYSLAGVDVARFAINSATGVLTFVNSPNYEAPADVGANNIYNVSVVVSDGAISTSRAVTIEILNDNEGPYISSLGGGATGVTTAPENSTATFLQVQSIDPDTNRPATGVTYSIVGGADAALFGISASSGFLYFNGSGRNFEAPGDTNGDNIYEVVVQVSDGFATPDTQAISVTVTNVNEAPVITSNGAGATASISIAENGAFVTTVASTDPENTPHTYSISGGADAALFTIDAVTGALSFISAPNFEAAGDSNGDNIYNVTVRASDGALVDTQALAVTVTNINEAPEIVSGGGGATTSYAVDENSLAVAAVVATDSESNPRTYSIVGGADAALFTIDPLTGALAFVTAPDREAPTDADGNNVYEVVVQVSDGSISDEQAISVTVNNVNEMPVITSDGGGASASVAAVENNIAVTTVTAGDVDSPSVTFAISGGADAALFAIDPVTGVLSFVSAPNFEAPADSGADNFYDVVVSASDGALVDTQSLAITVGNANEEPAITSDGGSAVAAIALAENGVAVTTVAASDPDGNPQTYAIIGGADAALFAIDPATGSLSFVSAPDFEAPTDADSNNVYEVVVQASDGSLTDSQAISVTVANVNEAPVILSNGGGVNATLTVGENGVVATTVAAGDVDGQTVTYAIAGGADASLFTIDAATGVLSFVSAPNFEAPADASADNVYDVLVSASDGSLIDTQALAVTVTNTNEGLSFTTGAAFGVMENTAAVATVSATDIDGDAVTYAIAGGADAALFTIDAVTGALSFVSAPNFEAPGDAGANNVYDVIVSATDGSFTASSAIVVTVGNANEGVSITSGTAFAIGENSTAVGNIVATDVDGDAVTYAIAGGADAALFAIDAATGALRLIAAPDFEAPGDADANNVYEVTVAATDGGFTASSSIAVTASNVNEGVSITSETEFAAVENGTAVGNITATDMDGDAVTYSIAGGADAALFTINSTSGALSFIAAPDFEASVDAGSNNIYDVTVRASDGSLSATQALSITVNNVNEAPEILSNGGGASAALSLGENIAAVATIAASDVDGNPLTYSISGGADASKFAIDTITGELRFLAVPNFEAPADAGGNNVYDVVVAVSDGVFTDTQAIAVTVNNVSEAVTIASDGGGAAASISIGENGTAVTSVAATDPDGGTVTYSISGGADAAKFSINASTGALQFVAAPNFEAPTDAGTNNVYDVIVAASDDSSVDTQAIAVTVTNVNEAVAITSNGAGDSAAVAINENVSAVTMVAASDIDGGAMTYSIAGGADATKFSINALTGALQFIAAPNFEAPTDAGANNVYDVIVAATDGVFTDTQAIAVTINNIVDGATITGTAGIDTISNSASLVQFRSTNAEDTINALAGADTISGGGGDDVINSGDGNDTIQYSGIAEGFDRVDGGLGTDTIVALANNTIIGLASITRVEGISAGSFTGVSISGSAAADTLSFAGMTLTGITRIDGGAGNDTITASSAAATLVGGSGDDTLTGGAGNDSFRFSGIADGFDAITGGAGTDTIRATANNTIIGLRSLATVEAITADAFTSVSISGSSAADTLNFSSVTLTGIAKIDGGAGNDVITGSAGADTLVGGLGNDTLTGGNGIDTVDYSYSASNWTINLAATSAQAVSGTETDTIATVENVIGGSGNDNIIGTTAANNLKGGAGDDRITGGAGNDALDGGIGIDVAIFAGFQASYSLTTLNGVVTVVDNQTTVDGNDGTDTLVGFEKVEFKGGVQVALAPPIVLDLNGDGVTLISQASSNARFDWDGDGTRNKTGWVGSDDGMLFFDRDGNGTVSGADELSFVNDKPGAKSDLDGLSAFDSNGDGQFSLLDSKWSAFKIWQDRNSDGTVDAGELSSLADAGVSSINLAGQAVNKRWNWNDNLTLNDGQFTRTDGSIGKLADVALSYQSSATSKAMVHSVEMAARVETLRAIRDASSGGLQNYLNMPANVDVFDYYGNAETPITEPLTPYRKVPTEAGSLGAVQLDTRINLMRQDMASFGVRNGEGDFGAAREQPGRYDYFA